MKDKKIVDEISIPLEFRGSDKPRFCFVVFSSKEEHIEMLARDAEDKGGEVEIVSMTHDLGEQFNRMGGIGALLRYRIR